MDAHISSLCDSAGCSRKDAELHIKFNSKVDGASNNIPNIALFSGDKWKKHQQEVIAKLNTILNPPKSDNVSVEKCKKCKEYKVVFQAIYMRSQDEPATIFYMCTNPKCKHTWRIDP